MNKIFKILALTIILFIFVQFPSPASAVCTYNASYCYGKPNPYYYCDAINNDNCCHSPNTCGGYCHNNCDSGYLFSCTGGTASCVAGCNGATPNFVVQSGDGTTIPDWGVALNTRTIRLTAGGCGATTGYVFDVQKYDPTIGWVPFYSNETTSNQVTVSLPAGTDGIAHYTTGVNFTNGGQHVARDFFVSDMSFNTPEKVSDTSYKLSWSYTKYNRIGTNPMNFRVKIGSQEYDVDENLGSWSDVDPARYKYRYNNNVTLSLPAGGSYTWGVNVQQGSFPTSGTTYAPPSMSFSTTPRVFEHGITKFYTISGNVFLDNTYSNSRGAQPNFTAAPVSITLRPPVSPGPTPSVPPANVTDNFNRADNNSSLGNANTGQPWQVYGSRFGISSNQAYPVNNGPTTYAVVDSGSADGTLQVTVPVNPQDTRIPFRVVDLNNMYWLERRGGSPPIYDVNKIVNGSRSSFPPLSVTAANGDRIKIVLSGPSIQVYINDTLASSITDSSINSTKHGIGTYGTNAPRFDDFSFTVRAPTPTLAPVVTSTGGYTSGANLLAGTYVVSLPNPLPSGYGMTYPLNNPPSFTVTVGPSCTKNSIDMVCTNGDITELNFGVTSNEPIAAPWIQTSGGDVHSNININTPGGP